MIDHYLLRVAQGELAIAKVIGDGNLWARAMQKMRVAMGTPRYKRGAQMDKLSKWLTSGEYLPHFMRDFHDQKDVFKTMHNTIKNADENGNPRDGHIYVVDTFLWYMARCGYTLQNHGKTSHSKICKLILTASKRNDRRLFQDAF